MWPLVHIFLFYILLLISQLIVDQCCPTSRRMKFGSRAFPIPCLRASSSVCNGFFRFTCGATPADLLAASMAAGHIPYMHAAEVGCQNSIGRQHSKQTHYHFSFFDYWFLKTTFKNLKCAISGELIFLFSWIFRYQIYIRQESQTFKITKCNVGRT